jgi:hypothetical protein
MRPSTLERAFELAASGRFLSVAEIRSRLSEEGYFTERVCGPVLCRQLMSIMAAARLAHVRSHDRRAAPGQRHPA